ncbi:J domain-containing protein [Paenibacillus elgii]
MNAQLKRRHVFSTDLPAIEAEIKAYQGNAAQAELTAGNAILEIGKRLLFVKVNDLIRGKWLPWLSSIGMEPRTAQRYMQAYEQFGKTTCASHLTAGIMFDLLSMPAEIDREQFLTNLHLVPSTGVTKLVTEMTQKERREVVQATKGKVIRREPSDHTKQAEPSRSEAGPDAWAAIEAKAEANLTEHERNTLFGLPLELVKRVMTSTLAEQKTVLSVAARLSSRRFYDRVDEIFSDVKSGKCADTIYRAHKLKPGPPISGCIDPCDVLGVDPSHNERDVKRKYREIVKKIHPDQGGSAFLFKLVHEAYQEYLG